MVSCCNSKTKSKKCNRKTDNKTFKLPRKYSIEECREGIDGFSKRSSCASFKGCRGISMGGGMRTKKKHCNNNKFGFLWTTHPDDNECFCNKNEKKQLINKNTRSQAWKCINSRNKKRINKRKNRTNKGRTRRTNIRARRTNRRKRSNRGTRSNRRGLLPQLKPISYKNKKHKYKLSDTTKKRRMAIDEGILYESKKKGMNKRKAALSKKSRFNVLRIYRRNNHKDQCLILTKDMKYIDRKYGLGNTKNIC